MASPTTVTTRVDISFYTMIFNTMIFNKFDSNFVQLRIYDIFYSKIVKILSHLSEWHVCMLYKVVI